MGRQWRTEVLDDAAWRPAPGLGRAARKAEQDEAAGGPERRLVAWVDPPPTASVYFRRVAGRRVYAYLRWAEAGRTSEAFICEAEQANRSANLVHAWETAHARRLLERRVKGQEPVDAPPPPRTESWASSPTVRKQMQANRGRDTKPELAIRSRVHRMGLRFRVATRPLPSSRRTADLVFTRAHVAVFVDGCYWHGCPDHLRPAQQNSEFWREKIKGNRMRDEETNQLLRAAGWTVVRIWEHEDPDTAARHIYSIVSSVALSHSG